MTSDERQLTHRRNFLESTALAGLAAGQPAVRPGVPGKSSGIYSVREFGATHGRKTDNAPAFQAAIDACHAAGGGMVYVPPGEYLSGGLLLKSRVALYLEAGAVILAGTTPEFYRKTGAELITAKGAEHVSVLGPGVLNGQATEDLGRRPGKAYEPRPAFRRRVMLLEDCRNVILRDFTILYSDGWACHLARCRKVQVDGLTILNNYFRTNSDGIDPDSCRDVRISNCHIVAGDDCICLKTQGGIPCEDVVVTNCTVESIATAIKLGTGSEGDFRRITISNCTVRNSTVGVGFFIKDGGTIEGVTVSNLAVETLREPMEVNPERLRNMIYPIFIDVEKRTAASPVGAIRDVVFSGLHLRSDNGILVQGMRESAIENLTLRDILFRVTRGFDYSEKQKHAGGTSNPDDDRITRFARQPSYCTLANVRGLVVDNLRVDVDPKVLDRFPRSALALHNVRGALLRSVYRTASGRGGPAIDLVETGDALVTGCTASSAPFLRAQGAGRGEVTLEANRFPQGGQAVEWR